MRNVVADAADVGDRASSRQLGIDGLDLDALPPDKSAVDGCAVLDRHVAGRELLVAALGGRAISYDDRRAACPLREIRHRIAVRLHRDTANGGIGLQLCRTC